MDAAAELGRNPVRKHHNVQPEYGDEQTDAGRDCRTNPSRTTKFSGANADGEISIFPVQLTTSRIGNLTRLIHTLVISYVMTIHTYHTYASDTFNIIYIYIYYGHFIPIMGAEKERQAHINWSMVICKMAATVSGTTTLRTTGPVPADSRQ